MQMQIQEINRIWERANQFITARLARKTSDFQILRGLTSRPMGIRIRKKC